MGTFYLRALEKWLAVPNHILVSHEARNGQTGREYFACRVQADDLPIFSGASLEELASNLPDEYQ